MIVQGRVGPVISAIGTNNPIRLDRQGAVVVAGSAGKYKEPSRNHFMCFSHTIERATSLPGTAMVGHIVWNPPGSGIMLSLAKWSIAIVATSASCTGISLAVASQGLTPASTTVADAYGSCFLSSGFSANCIAKAYAIATLLATPTRIMNLVHNTADIAATGIDNMSGDLDGVFTVPEGYAICLVADGGAVAASGMTSSLFWEEIPAC